MSKIHGTYTVAVAKKLTELIKDDKKRYKGIKVYYDHGDSSNPQVCQPTTYMGRRYGNDATLSGVNIELLQTEGIKISMELH